MFRDNNTVNTRWTILKARDGEAIHTSIYEPDSKTLASAILVIVHGVSEHSGRYERCARELAGLGFMVCAYDQRGHGLSGGARVYVASFESYVSDLECVIDHVKTAGQSLPVIVYGHSMGAVIAALFAAQLPGNLDYLILSGCPVSQLNATPAWVRSVFHVVARLLGHVSIRTPISPDQLSNDESVWQNYVDDERVTLRLSLRWMDEFLQACRGVLECAGEIQVPVLLLHGSQDTLAKPEGSRKVFELIRMADKQLKIIQGGRHELHNELPEYRNIWWNTLTGWLNSHITL